jgi:hypothetical protein
MLYDPSDNQLKVDSSLSSAKRMDARTTNGRIAIRNEEILTLRAEREKHKQETEKLKVEAEYYRIKTAYLKTKMSKVHDDSE